MEKLLYIVLLLIVVMWGTNHLLQNDQSSSHIKQTEIPKPTKSITVPQGWKIYKDTKFNYAVSYPVDQKFTVQPNGTNSIMIVKLTTEPGAGPANFIYVSVIPKNSFVNSGVIYNFNQPQFEMLEQIKVGDSISLSQNDNPELNDYFTYKRLPDITLASYKAKVYSNDKPWEFPSGTSEFRYYIEKNSFIYLIGGYVEASDIQNYYISKKTFFEILKTFTFID